MKIVIAGGSGFIGKNLTDFLINEGHEVTILTRTNMPTPTTVSYVSWLKEGAAPEKELGTVDVFINLAGVSINDGRWSKKHQEQIYQSRMSATDELLRIITALPQKPSALINASAIGIYPSSVDTVYTEESHMIADDFLGKTVYEWENKAKEVDKLGVRCVLMRFGVVLGNVGGALPLMALPYKFFVGGRVGSGQQWVSWVHIQDVSRAIAFAVENKHIYGPVNVTAPTPLRMNEFGKRIAAVLNRPHWIQVPAFAMNLLLGKKSKLVLEGQHVQPSVLEKEKFEFLFPTVDLALVDLFQK
jgi:uncharacterized protein